jgi:hypothetical protein
LSAGMIMRGERVGMARRQGRERGCNAIEVVGWGKAESWKEMMVVDGGGEKQTAV